MKRRVINKKTRALTGLVCVCAASLLLSCLPGNETENTSRSADSTVADITVPQGFAFTTTRKVRLSMEGDAVAGTSDDLVKDARPSVIPRQDAFANVHVELFFTAL